MEIEVWKDIDGYSGVYQVSSLGRVRTVEDPNPKRKDRCRKEHIHVGGLSGKKYGKYRFILLRKNGKVGKFSIHRLVAQAFIPNPENKLQIDHIDGDKLNNKVDNLRWVTGKENVHNSITLIARSDKVRKIVSRKVGKYSLDGRILEVYGSCMEAAVMNNKKSPSGVIEACSGKRTHCGGFVFKYLDNNRTHGEKFLE